MQTRTWVVCWMVLLAALTRLIPHPPNFAAVTALALFGAAYLPSRILALVAPLIAMYISDFALNQLTRHQLLTGWIADGKGFYSEMWMVYLATVVVAALGFLLRRRRSAVAIGGTTLLASVVYFILTNFAWWPGYHLYPHTWAGLWQGYLEGIPFFHWTLLGNLFFATVLFGGFALAERRMPALAQSTR